MKQSYYLVDGIGRIETINAELQEMGVDEHHIHVLGENTEAIESHHLPRARVIDETDIVRFSERGALLGIILGLLFFIFGLTYKPFGIEIDGVALVMITVLIIGFCTWWGGIFGAYFDNYRIASIKRKVRGDRYLVMIDTAATEVKSIRQMMTEKHPQAKWVGQNSTFANPFRAAQRSES